MLSAGAKPAPKRSPDLTGDFGDAWRLDLAKARTSAGLKAGPDEATVAAWIVYAPHSHPIWPTVLVAVVHLREMEGQTRAPSIHLPGATHEIQVLALDPDGIAGVEATIDDAAVNLRFLSPTNFTGQWVSTSDAKAAERCEKTVADIVEGRLNPDTDGLSQWVSRFGDSCVKLGFRSSKGSC